MTEFFKRESWTKSVGTDVNSLLVEAGAPAVSRVRGMDIMEAMHDGKLAAAVNAEVMMATIMFAQAKGLDGLEPQLIMAKDDYASKVGAAIEGVDGKQAAKQLEKDLAAQLSRGRA